MSVFKVVALLTRRASVTRAAFTEQWLALAQTERASTGLIGYVHNVPLGADAPIENAPPAVFDGADEYWFVNREAAADHFRSRSGRLHALLESAEAIVCGTPHVLLESSTRSTDAVKIITLASRRQDMTTEAFAHHWIHVHSALALQGPGIQDRLQRLEACPDDGTPLAFTRRAPFDGAGAIEFVDQSALLAEFASEYYRDVLAPDEPRFTDPSRSAALMVRPVVVHV